MNPIALARSRPVEIWTLAALVLLGWLGRQVVFWDATSSDFDRVDPVEGFFYDASGGSQLAGLAVAAWLIWRRRKRVAAAVARSRARDRSWIALPLMILALAVRAWSAHTGAVDLQIPALALALLAGGAVLGGGEGARALLVPAGVLLMAMPIPLAVVNALIYPMQRMTAEGVSMLLQLVGIPHRLLGEQIFARGHAFYVVEGCAGLRALQTLALATVAYAELLFRNRRQVMLLLGVMPLVAIAVNQARVLSIVLNPFSDLSGDHAMQGIVMICMGVVVIAGIDALLQRLERRGARAAEQDAAAPEEVTSIADVVPRAGREIVASWRILVPIFLFALAYGVGMSGIPIWTRPPPPAPRAAEFPTKLGEWRAVRTLRPDREFLGSVEWSDWVHRRYVSEEGEIELMMLGDDHRVRHQNVLSFKTALARPGYRVESVEALELGPNAQRGLRLGLSGIEGRVAVVHWRVAAASPLEELARSALALDQSALHRSARTFAIRLAIELSDDPAEARRQEALLGKSAREFDRALVEAGLAGPAR